MDLFDVPTIAMVLMCNEDLQTRLILKETVPPMNFMYGLGVIGLLYRTGEANSIGEYCKNWCEST